MNDNGDPKYTLVDGEAWRASEEEPIYLLSGYTLENGTELREEDIWLFHQRIYATDYVEWTVDDVLCPDGIGSLLLQAEDVVRYWDKIDAEDEQSDAEGDESES